MKQKAFKIGRETVYKIEDIIEWLNSNYEEIFKQHNHGLAIFMIISSRNGPVFFEEKQMIKMT